MMPLVSLRTHWRLAVIIFTVILVVGGFAAWKKGGKYTYSVSATVYVSQQFTSILKSSKEQEMAGSQAFKQFMEQQVQNISRHDILVEALHRLGPRRNVWQAPGESDRHAAERLHAALVIKSIKDTFLITVTLESERQDGLDEVLNSVMDTYLEKSQEMGSFYGTDKRLAVLRERRQKITYSMEKNMARRAQIAQELGVSSFAATAINPYDQVYTDSLAALAVAQRNRISSESSLAVFEGKGGQEALAAIAFDPVQKDAGLNSLKANMHQRRSQLIQQISGLEDNHPLTSQIKQELKQIDDELNHITTDVFNAVASSIVEQRRTDVRRDRQIESELAREIAVVRQKASGYAALFNEGLALNSNIDRSRSQLDDVDNRIDFFETESQAPGFIRIDSRALPPESPVKGGRKKPLLIVVVAAIALSLGAPIGLDMLDVRVKTPKGVIKIIGHPPLAALLEPSENVAVQRVRADQFRRLAIAMDRERQTHGNHIILMTSVKPGAGVTDLAFEMAHELSEMGVRTLVVEVNPFKPDPRYSSEPMRPGLLDLLVEDIDAAEAVSPAVQLLPERIGVGFALDPHLFAYPRLRQRLDELKTLYDVIILDSPPVLMSGDTEYLAGISDVSLLLIGSGQVGPGELRRAADILQKVNPPVVGFILTHMTIHKGGGYFAKQVEEYQAAEAKAQASLNLHPLNNPPS